MRTFLIAVMLCLCCATMGRADQIAIAEDGRKVLLKDDGTWEYVKEEADAKKEFHFRKTRWGMTREEVEKAEGKKSDIEQGDLIAYNVRVMDMECLLIYTFAEDRLVRSRYSFSNPHANENLYLEDRLTALDKLKQKYGDPTEDNTYWSSNLYRDDPTRWGFALSIGDVSYYTKWQTNDTKITLALYGDNYEVTFGIQYDSIELKKLQEKVEQKKVLDDL